jgi:hypothetical protein
MLTVVVLGVPLEARLWEIISHSEAERSTGYGKQLPKGNTHRVREELFSLEAVQ